MPPKAKKSSTTARQRPTAPRTAAPRSADGEYAATTWGADAAPPVVGYAEDITVPSGQRALVRRPGVHGLVAAGILDHVDSLTALVGEKHIKRVEGKPQVDVKALSQDGKRLAESLDVIDKIVCHVVLKPIITPTPNCKVCNKNLEWHAWADAKEVDHSPDIEFEKGLIYASQVDLEDKMFLLNFAVGGTRSLESFRGESDELVASLAT
jgi:hypothetical protein